MNTQGNVPPGWYPDPHGAVQTLRYWDGALWTAHTSPAQQAPAPAPQYGDPHNQYGGAGSQYGDPHNQYGGAGSQYGGAGSQYGAAGGQYGDPRNRPTAPPPRQQPVDARVQRQVRKQAKVATAGPGGGTLFTEPVLVVNQEPKLFELTNEYAVMDQEGRALGSVVEVGQGKLKKILRFVSSLDQFLTHKLEVRDVHGQPQLVLTRPLKFFKSRMIVTRPDGPPVGEIVQQNVFGKIKFAMNADGRQVGAIMAENWRAWNFVIVDHADNEVARITKTWEGFAKTLFTTADNYVLQIHFRLPEPLLSLVVATALTVDTALKQDARGEN
ncbi:phospholipid scramblase-related protein [Streptomyces sp. NPDC001288]|uniref:phospholipid scramblase-related protein n=1 Tax=unclassified Streptomyces TaxID=2593676 RepID=UPI003316BE10